MVVKNVNFAARWLCSKVTKRQDAYATNWKVFLIIVSSHSQCRLVIQTRSHCLPKSRLFAQSSSFKLSKKIPRLCQTNSLRNRRKFFGNFAQFIRKSYKLPNSFCPYTTLIFNSNKYFFHFRTLNKNHIKWKVVIEGFGSGELFSTFRVWPTIEARQNNEQLDPWGRGRLWENFCFNF